MIFIEEKKWKNKSQLISLLFSIFKRLWQLTQEKEPRKRRGEVVVAAAVIRASHRQYAAVAVVVLPLLWVKMCFVPLFSSYNLLLITLFKCFSQTNLIYKLIFLKNYFELLRDTPDFFKITFSPEDKYLKS